MRNKPMTEERKKQESCKRTDDEIFSLIVFFNLSSDMVDNSMISSATSTVWGSCTEGRRSHTRRLSSLFFFKIFFIFFEDLIGRCRWTFMIQNMLQYVRLSVCRFWLVEETLKHSQLKSPDADGVHSFWVMVTSNTPAHEAPPTLCWLVKPRPLFVLPAGSSHFHHQSFC